MAYEKVSKYMGLAFDDPNKKTWGECSAYVVDKIKNEEWIGSHWPKYYETIMHYNAEYRVKEKFSRCYYRNKKPLAPILMDNPDMCNVLK